MDSVLERPALDVETSIVCLEIAKYAICTAVFLNMPTERAAFVARLDKFSQRMVS